MVLGLRRRGGTGYSHQDTTRFHRVRVSCSRDDSRHDADDSGMGTSHRLPLSVYRHCLLAEHTTPPYRRAGASTHPGQEARSCPREKGCRHQADSSQATGTRGQLKVSRHDTLCPELELFEQIRIAAVRS